MRDLSSGRSLTWEELWKASGSAADYLRKNSATDVVILRLSSPLEMVTALLGAWRAGLTPFPVGSSETTGDLAHIVEQVGAGCMILDDIPLSGVPGAGISHITPAATELLLQAPSVDGEPRVVEFAPGAAAEAASLERRLHPGLYREGARILVLRPLSAVAGLYFVFPALAHGAELLFAPDLMRMPHAEGFLRARQEFRPDATYLTTSHFRSVLRTLPQGWQGEGIDGGLMTIGPFVEEHEARLVRERFRAVPWRRYGMTEFLHALAAYEVPGAGKRDAAYMGELCPGVEAKVNGGHLAFRSPAMARGERRQGASAPLAGNSFFRTQDKGWLEGDSVYLVGRESNMLSVGGHHFHPLEVELAARKVPGVSEAAAVGVADELRVQRVVLVIEASGGNPARVAAAVEAHLASALPVIKRPWKILVRDRLPRLPDGAVDRDAVRV